MDELALIDVQVCFVDPAGETIIDLHVPPTTSLMNALKLSQILSLRPDIDLQACKLGVFGKLKSPDAILMQGDRVEIYRPLKFEPMEARRKRASKNKI